MRSFSSKPIRPFVIVLFPNYTKQRVQTGINVKSHRGWVMAAKKQNYSERKWI